MMKVKILGLLAAGLLAALPSNAATLQSNGALGVNVNGTLYDVTFVADSCVALFSGCDEQSDFFFQNITDAAAATTALYDLILPSLGTSPPTAANCGAPLCLIATPFAVNTIITGWTTAKAVAFTKDASGTLVATNGFNLIEPGNGNSGAVYYAMWGRTPPRVGVPEPGTLALLGLGLAGLGLSRRRKAH